jgi:hypothetical protein
MGFETTIAAFERVKTVHALDCAAAVIGSYNSTYLYTYNRSSHEYLEIIRN